MPAHPGKGIIVNICIPVLEDKGLESPVSPHFGSAPLFMIVDTESGSCRSVPNGNLSHGHGMCQALMSLAGENLDAMVVGGIGVGALGKLQGANIRVYLAEFPTAGAALAAFKDGTLRPVTRQSACDRHNHGPQDQNARHPGSCHVEGRVRP